MIFYVEVRAVRWGTYSVVRQLFCVSEPSKYRALSQAIERYSGPCIGWSVSAKVVSQQYFELLEKQMKDREFA
jgi:hypothetical protein